MVPGKRTREYSSDFNSGHKDKPISSSPLKRMHDEDVSGMEAMLRRRKKTKTKLATLVSSSSNTKMAWTKDDELIVLGSIVDYEKETKLRFNSDWEAFYVYVKDFIEADFSKKQLIDKIRNLNRRFLGNKARSNDVEGPSFTNTEDDEIFKLSVIIWDTNETECASDENMDQAKDLPCVDHERVDENIDQAKDVPCVEHERVNEDMDQAKDVASVEHELANENIDQAKDVPYVEHEMVDVDENMDQANVVLELNTDAPCVEHEPVDENIDQAKVLELNKDAPCVEHELVDANTNQKKDVPYVEHEGVNENMEQEEGVPCSEDEQVSNVSTETNKEDKEKGEQDAVNEFCVLKDAPTDSEEKDKTEEDEFCALKDALEATTVFQSIGKYQQKLLLDNLKTLGAQRRKELADEWKSLLDEEMKLSAKKLSLSAKIASAGEESC